MVKVGRFSSRGLVVGVILSTGLVVAALGIWKNWFGLRRMLYLDRRIHALTFPQPGQVLQRGADALATVPLTGRVGWLARTVEVATTQADDLDVAEHEWQVLGSPTRTSFQGRLALPTGCSRLFVRVGEPRPPQAFNHVETCEVCVGEVFVVAGQSNAAGSCATLFTARSPFVRTGQLDDADRLVWKLGDDPQTANGGGSVWPLVGDALVERLEVPVGFVNLAVGGSSIRDWQPGTANFTRLVQTLRALGPTGARAILWHQGESDAGMTADDYARYLRALITATHQALGTSAVPWVVAQASFKDGQTYDGVRAGQQQVWASGLARRGPDTDQLGPALRQPDRVHFNAEGTRAAAGLWTAAILEAIFQAPPPADAPPVSGGSAKLSPETGRHRPF